MGCHHIASSHLLWRAAYSRRHILSILWVLYSSVFVIYVFAVLAYIPCAHLQSRQCSSCLSWGSVQGVSWGSFLSLLVIFMFWYSLTLHISDFHVRYSRTPPFYWERTVSVCSWLCLLCLSSVFFFFTPIRLEGSIFGGPYISGGPYIFGGPSLYLEGHIYLEGYIYLAGYIYLRTILTLRYQLRQKWRHWSLEIRTRYT